MEDPQHPTTSDPFIARGTWAAKALFISVGTVLYGPLCSEPSLGISDEVIVHVSGGHIARGIA